jgi:hypothetical protein
MTKTHIAPAATTAQCPRCLAHGCDQIIGSDCPVCLSCDDTHQVYCPACEGVGLNLDDSDCRPCKGTGNARCWRC